MTPLSLSGFPFLNSVPKVFCICSPDSKEVFYHLFPKHQASDINLNHPTFLKSSGRRVSARDIAQETGNLESRPSLLSVAKVKLLDITYCSQFCHQKHRDYKNLIA